MEEKDPLTTLCLCVSVVPNDGAIMRRRGFTLIEMMVATALTMFIMVILTQAFVTSLDIFSQLKAIGDMEEDLRTASNLLVNDLQRDHFEGKRRVSDPSFTTIRPREGFFHIQVGTVTPAPPAGATEGADADGILSARITNANMALHFTNRHIGNRRENFVTALIPTTIPASPFLNPAMQTNFFKQPGDSMYQESANAFHSQWEEVAWWLQRTGTTLDPTDTASTVSLALNRVPVYTLWRSQYVVVPDPTAVNAANIAGGLLPEYPNFCCKVGGAGTLVFAAPEDLAANPAAGNNRRFLYGGSAAANTANLGLDAQGRPRSATVVLSNVISFHVRMLRPRTGTIAALSTATTPVLINSPAHNLANGALVTIQGGGIQALGTPPFSITVVDANNFTLNSSTGAGGFVAGGTWTALGPSALAAATLDPVGGFENVTAAYESSTTGIRIHALEVTFRIWDPKTKQARQVTVMQDM